MIDLDWLTDRLVAVLRWQLAHPGGADHPEAPDVPVAGLRVWGIFLDLTRGRGGGFGPAPIAYSEIEAYARVRREPIRPFELDMIRALDAAFMEFAAKRSKAEAGSEPAEVQSRPMSGALFDALMGPV